MHKYITAKTDTNIRTYTYINEYMCVYNYLCKYVQYIHTFIAQTCTLRTLSHRHTTQNIKF